MAAGHVCNQINLHSTPLGQQPLVKRIITAPPHPWPSSSSTRSKSLDFWFRSFDTVYNLLLSPSPSPTDIYFPSFSLSDNQIQSHDDPLDVIHALSNSRQITLTVHFLCLQPEQLQHLHFAI